MKAGHFTIGALALLGFAAAQPHGHRRHRHFKRDYVTEVTVVTVTGAEVVVWVDTDGVAYSTDTVDRNLAPPTPTAQVVATPASKSAHQDVTTTLTSTVQVMKAAVSSEASPSTPSSTAAETSSPTPSETVEPTSSEASVPTASDVLTQASSNVPDSTSSGVAESTTSDVPDLTTNETPEPSSTETPASSTPSDTPFVTSSIVSEASSTTAEPNAPSATQAPSSAPSSGFPAGIAWDPFTGTSQSTTCKSDSQIADEFNAMKAYAVVRLYGTGCNQVALALQHVRANGQKLMLGIYVPDETVSDDVKIFSEAVNSYANGKWDDIILITVGNEQVNSQGMTASAVVDAISQARQQLSAAGYTGPVGTVDTVPATVDNPQLCQNSDYAMVNCHAFFDSQTSAANAGTFVKNQMQQVAQACPGKEIIVTESGWPSQGDANGMAVPSPANQKAALQSLRDAFSDKIILFSAFDTPWKSDSAGTFDAEKYWGFM